MKRKFTPLILILIFCGFTAFVILKYNKEIKGDVVAFYPLKDREGPSALLPEWATIKENGNKMIRVIRDKPDDAKTALSLASLYVQEARITGNYEYYNAAALHYVEKVIVNNPKDFNALLLKALIQLSQHHFQEALETADIAVKINPYSAFIYGILIDGNVEMGNYEKAVEYSDKMISIRPDIRSYSRVAYLREIHGDMDGAIEAMKMAVGAGAYGEESTEWCRIQLGQLYENTNQMKHAEMHYTIALTERPGYAYALAGLSRIAMSQKNYEKATALCLQAIEAGNDFGFKEQLAKIYIQTGKNTQAEKLLESIVVELTKEDETETGNNHHAGIDLANVYLLQSKPAKALESARKEYGIRPDNIDVNHTLGWIYFKTGDHKNALKHIQMAMRTNYKHPEFLHRAGIIHANAGAVDIAKKLMQDIRQPDFYFYPELKDEVSIAMNGF
jgi:tetratricopeptide (TPR) repeat protein